MTEEFDALLRFDPVRAIAFAVGVLLLGIVLDLALRYFERRAIANNRHRTGVVLGAQLKIQRIDVNLWDS